MWSLDLSKLNTWTCHKELTTLPDDLKPVQSDSDGDSEDDGDAADDADVGVKASFKLKPASGA